MSMDELKVAGDALPGAWIAPLLHGDFGAVSLTVPSGYAAYARICHPATGRDGARASWSDVASALGRTAHPLMQWHTLVGSPDPFNFAGSLWQGENPDCGILAPDLLAATCEVLRHHTADAASCFFALWTGWGWIGPSGPRLELPDRDYVLLAGPLSAATNISNPGWMNPLVAQSPNLLWPADQAWCLASEIDFDSTLIGGTADLIGAILDAPGLDAWRVGPDDSLAYNADLINRVPTASPPA
jgi:hypothetical protein